MKACFFIRFFSSLLLYRQINALTEERKGLKERRHESLSAKNLSFGPSLFIILLSIIKLAMICLHCCEANAHSLCTGLSITKGRDCLTELKTFKNETQSVSYRSSTNCTPVSKNCLASDRKDIQKSCLLIHWNCKFNCTLHHQDNRQLTIGLAINCPGSRTTTLTGLFPLLLSPNRKLSANLRNLPEISTQKNSIPTIFYNSKKSI